MNLKEALKDKLTKAELEHLKRSQDIIGDIAIIEIPDELEKKEKLIAETLLETKHYLNTVLKKGKHEGEFRVQKLKWLAGEKKKIALYRENHVIMEVDVEKIYFSPRLSTERERIADLVKPGERVLVMGSGCAPFPLVIARKSKAKEIIGVEINPVAHEYGLKNIKLNKFTNIELHCGDNAKIVPTLGKFDRIVMPLPHNAVDYLDIARDACKKGGMIHLYGFFSDEKSAKKAARRKAKNVTKCGQIARNEFRMCVDIKKPYF